MEIQWLWMLSDIYQLVLKVKEKFVKSKAKIYSYIPLLKLTMLIIMLMD